MAIGKAFLSFLMTVTSNTACVLPIANIKTNINHLLETLVHASGFRKIAHQLSDYNYEALLGENGSLNTLLTYITIKENSAGVRQYSLNRMD
jgi:Tol biopolymer transport system component